TIYKSGTRRFPATSGTSPASRQADPPGVADRRRPSIHLAAVSRDCLTVVVLEREVLQPRVNTADRERAVALTVDEPQVILIDRRCLRHFQRAAMHDLFGVHAGHAVRRLIRRPQTISHSDGIA